MFPSLFADLASSLTRLLTPISFSSALSSIVITLSSLGIKFDKALRNVVLPEPVPPEIKILYLAFTSFSKYIAASRLMAPSSISLSIVRGSS